MRVGWMKFKIPYVKVRERHNGKAQRTNYKMTSWTRRDFKRLSPCRLCTGASGRAYACRAPRRCRRSRPLRGTARSPSLANPTATPPRRTAGRTPGTGGRRKPATRERNEGWGKRERELSPTTQNKKKSYLIGLQEHVDHARRAVAPVHQQVPVVPDAGRVVARGELEAADVVDAGLHQPVHVLLHADEAWLVEEGLAFSGR